MTNDIYDLSYCLFELEAPKKKVRCVMYQVNKANKLQHYVVDFTIFD